MVILMAQKNKRFCKYCKEELRALDSNSTAVKRMNKDGYYYVCDKNEVNNCHEPMDNLELIEHLAKCKGLM